MIKKNIFLVIILISFYMMSFAQEIINPIDPQPESSELQQYIRMIDENNITTIKSWNKNFPGSIDIASMEEQDVKKLLSLAFFSRMNNPREFKEKIRNFGKIVEKDRSKYTKNYQAADDLFFVKEQYENFEFKNKHILYDLYIAPYVFIGTITDIDTLYDQGGYLKIIKYEMTISENINKYYKKNAINKQLIFKFSTGHWGSFRSEGHGPLSYITPKEIYKKLPPKNNFIVGDKYLIFISSIIYNFRKVDDIYKELPTLRITTYTNLNFPVKNSLIYDHFGYFGKGEKTYLSIEEVKNIINSIISELVIWRN